MHVFINRSRQAFTVATQHVDDLVVRAKAQRTHHFSQRQLPCPVNPYVRDALCIGFVFQPGTTVWNKSSTIAWPAVFVIFFIVVNAR